jgi:hypothetical protein
VLDCVGLEARLVGRGVLEMCFIAIVTNFVGSVKHNPIIIYRYGIRDTGVNSLSEKKNKLLQQYAFDSVINKDCTIHNAKYLQMLVALHLATAFSAVL